MKKEEIFEYVKKQYGTVPVYLWAQSPDNAVLRHIVITHILKQYLLFFTSQI